ncbi:hypothetical protein [uncultured Roseobacter sp.]|uniref:hypothetical protein n=1 Tax=uncultured Roseobacter sp. TaxID=114847 RepID=UPI00263717BD|nr:hypothetical protein [uncultured Roseobacter sp.]
MTGEPGVSWSAAEILALAGKAARGAGAPAGQAARFGRAAAHHLMAGHRPDDLDRALDALPGGPVIHLPAALDEVMAGDSTVITSDAPGNLVHSYVAVLPFASRARAQGPDTWQIDVDLSQPSPRIPPRRIAGAQALVEKMTELAARTFVPETEASRAAGAGAGLTDND